MEHEHDDGWQQEKVADPVTAPEFPSIELTNRDLHTENLHGSLLKGLETYPGFTPEN
jgi:hypothetical protein